MVEGTSEGSKPKPGRAGGAAAFLSRLEGAHEEVELCLAALDTSMRLAEPEANRFSAIRLRLAKANLARTQLARECCGELIRGAAGGAQPLQDLRQREIEHCGAVSNHVRQWTPQALGADWEGYCRATRELLERVRELVASERKLLLPLLRDAA